MIAVIGGPPRGSETTTDGAPRAAHFAGAGSPCRLSLARCIPQDGKAVQTGAGAKPPPACGLALGRVLRSRFKTCVTNPKRQRGRPSLTLRVGVETTSNPQAGRYIPPARLIATSPAGHDSRRAAAPTPARARSPA